MRKTRLALFLAVLAASLPLGHASAQVPEGKPTDLIFFSNETQRGSGVAAPAEGPGPAAKTIDGDISDWVGESSMYGGTVVYSAGELVYQDHLFDAHGPDDGRDASRFATTDPVEEAYPGAYRVDAMAQADAPGQLGLPTPEQFQYGESYGDAEGHQDRSDLLEVRAAISGSDLALLARTTTMTSAGDTALLVLADTLPGENLVNVPFGSGLTTTSGDVAVFIADGTIRLADLATGAITHLPGTASADPSGWNNSLEAALPASTISAADGSISLAIASGKPNAANDGFAPLSIETNNDLSHANVANVAFRLQEPPRTWFDQAQALSLYARSIDPFFLDVDVAALTSGASQEWEPGPGYHDRIFYSPPSTGVPQENGRNGVYQHYGVYLPSSYDGTEAAALQWWLHWRGGSAHTASGVVPKVFTQFGEDRDAIVVSPSGRGTSTWYVGRGHVDIRQVWADVFDTFAIDDNHVYVTGHSMGGWGSYLLTLLYPDRFAAAAPVAGPVTQGAWTGADFEGCDELVYDDYSPCYISANESRPRDQFTRKILENARHVPYAILHGTSDELVPYSGVFRQHERLIELGYRHRLYTYPGYEHYSHPLADQWAEAASYLHSFTRPENPSRVTYKRDMPFERATEEVQSGGAQLNFDFDSAYWMSELTPVDLQAGVASFDGRSLAIPEDPYLATPESGAPTAPGQTGPYVITGIQWIDDLTRETPTAENTFTATLTKTAAVRLDLERMALDTTDTIAGSVTTDGDLSLRLDGGWTAAPDVTIDGQSVPVSTSGGVATVVVPAGTHSLTITPPSTSAEKITSLSFTGRSDTSAQYSDDATLEARLTDPDGTPVSGETLSFTLGSSSATAVTDGDGVASVSLPVTDPPGVHEAIVSFSGRDGAFSPSVSVVPFSVTKEVTDLTLVVVGKGSKRTLTASLTEDASTPMSGREIVFRANGTSIGTATTDDDGVATLAVPAGYRGGDITFTASYAGDSFYSESSDSQAV